jgi:hypothetical protein
VVKGNKRTTMRNAVDAQSTMSNGAAVADVNAHDVAKIGRALAREKTERARERNGWCARVGAHYFIVSTSKLAETKAAFERQSFEIKQLNAQYRKLERDYYAQHKELNERRLCGACKCLAGLCTLGVCCISNARNASRCAHTCTQQFGAASGGCTIIRCTEQFRLLSWRSVSALDVQLKRHHMCITCSVSKPSHSVALLLAENTELKEECQRLRAVGRNDDVTLRLRTEVSATAVLAGVTFCGQRDQYRDRTESLKRQLNEKHLHNDQLDQVREKVRSLEQQVQSMTGVRAVRVCAYTPPRSGTQPHASDRYQSAGGIEFKRNKSTTM